MIRYEVSGHTPQGEPITEIVLAPTPEAAERQVGFVVVSVKTPLGATEKVIKRVGEGLSAGLHVVDRVVESPANIAQSKSGKQHGCLRMICWAVLIVFPPAWPFLLIYAVRKRER